MEWKPLSVTKQVYCQFMVEKVIPAIKEKWPAGVARNVRIQQDNAPSHISVDDPEFLAAATADGWNILLYCQPPNSPDTNVLDLGFFAAIQSLQHQKSCRNIQELVTAVNDAFEEFEPDRLNKVFLSLFACYNSIVECNGGNTYKLPHMRKDALARVGQLPLTIGAVGTEWVDDFDENENENDDNDNGNENENENENDENVDENGNDENGENGENVQMTEEI